jgi:hypothetical protein
MLNKTKTIFLALLFIFTALYLPADDKVAILVDELLQNAAGFSTALSGYISEVESNFPNVDVLTPYYDDYWSMDPVTGIRAAIQAIRNSYSDLVGVILIGEIPLVMYQSFNWNTDNVNDPNNDAAIYYPVSLLYEDLYGHFDDDWTLDANGKKTPGSDGFIDSWEHDTTTTTDIIDIWVSIIRPTEELYTLESTPAVYQAESATLGTGGPTPVPSIVYDSDCDGNYKVENISGGRANYLEFGAVTVSTSGLHELTIYY